MAVPTLTNRRIGVCEETHQYDFFCSDCNSVFCAKCWVRKHRDERKQSHVALELNDVMARNKDNIDESIRNLKELSGTVDTIIKKRTQEMQEKDEKFANFCAEVQRLLMCDTRERYLRNLQTTRYEIETSMQKENWQMPKEVVDAISGQLDIFEGLQATNEMVHHKLNEEWQDIDLSDALDMALTSIKQFKIPQTQAKENLSTSMPKDWFHMRR